MKKFASALALAAAMGLPAAAHADLNISGYVSMGVASYSYAGEDNGMEAESSGIRVDDGRYSRFRFSGNEDIGNGLKADVMIEQRFLADTAGASGVANGNVWVGLSGGFGQVRLGRIDTYYSDGVLTELSRATAFNSFGTLSLLTQVNGSYAVTPSRHNNLVRYDTPNMGGFKGAIAFSPNSGGDEGNSFTTVDATDGQTLYASGYYFKGPIYAGASYVNQDYEGNDASVTGIRAYGAYTLPFGLKIGLNVDKTETDDGTNSDSRTAWFVPVTFKTGSHAVYGLVGQAGEMGDVEDSGATMFNIGYDYGLSARTSIGVNYTNIDNDDAGNYRLFLGGVLPALGGNAPAAGAPGVDQSVIYAGIAHAF